MLKLLKWGSIILLSIGLLVFPRGVTADTQLQETVQVTLHKLLFPTGELPDSQQASGEEGTLLQNYRGLNGVVYHVYDVTETFYQLRENGETVQDAQHRISELGTSAGTYVSEGITSNQTGEDGVVSFTVAAIDTKKRDKAYLFIETEAPEVVKERAENMVVVLPVYDTSGEELFNIHLYPKNEENSYPQPPLEKKVGEAELGTSIGDKVTYTLTTTIPVNILSYEKFVLADAADQALTFLPESMRVEMDGKEIFSGYTIKEEQHGFTINFSIADLQEYAKKQLKVTYQMQLGEDAQPDMPILNEGRLDFGHDPVIKKVAIRTGGKRFVKVASDSQEKTLAGATFIVKNSEGLYLSKQSTGYDWKKDKISATKITSDRFGDFSIIGLKDGHYFLEEVHAPDGYILSRTDIPFEITQYSYKNKDEAIVPLKIVNKKEKSQKIFPKTSESGATVLSVVGFILVYFVVRYIVAKRRGR